MRERVQTVLAETGSQRVMNYELGHLICSLLSSFVFPSLVLYVAGHKKISANNASPSRIVYSVCF